MAAAAVPLKIHVSRANQGEMGERILILPDVTAETSESIIVEGVNITVMLKDIFTVSGAVVIPYYADGMLFNLMEAKNQPPSGQTITCPDGNIGTIPSYVTGISQFILYRYDKDAHRLEADLETIGALCTPHEQLVIPTFGIRNGVTCYMVAMKIFYSILSCLSTETSQLRKLDNIIITTKFDQSSSTRVIKHLLNLFTIHKLSHKEPECIVCRDMKRSVILSCGHRILCTRCSMDVAQNRCPLCNQINIRSYPCYTVTDMTETPCGQGHTKSGKIFVPCGHWNVCCLECEPKHLTAKKCPICQEDLLASIKLFQ